MTVGAEGTVGCVIKIKINLYVPYLVFYGAFWDPFQEFDEKKIILGHLPTFF